MNEASPNTDAIARELAALGEDPPSEAELTLLRGGALDDEPASATVARLAELAEPFGFDKLSELETHRAWRRVEQQLEDSNEVSSPAASTSAATGAGSRRWLFGAAGLAAAAAVLLIVIPRDNNDNNDGAPELSAEQVTEQGETLRVALRALDDGRSDSQRARARAAEYQRRLEEQGG